MYKSFKSEEPCPWCGCHDVTIEDHPIGDGYVHAVCDWCGSTSPAIDRPKPGLTLAGTALRAWENRKSWEQRFERN